MCVCVHHYCLHTVTIVYVRKDEEEVYHALYLDSLTVHDFKLQVLKSSCAMTVYTIEVCRTSPIEQVLITMS